MLVPPFSDITAAIPCQLRPRRFDLLRDPTAVTDLLASLELVTKVRLTLPAIAQRAASPWRPRRQHKQLIYPVLYYHLSLHHHPLSIIYYFTQSLSAPLRYWNHLNCCLGSTRNFITLLSMSLPAITGFVIMSYR